MQGSVRGCREGREKSPVERREAVEGAIGMGLKRGEGRVVRSFSRCRGKISRRGRAHFGGRAEEDGVESKTAVGAKGELRKAVKCVTVEG